MPTRRDFIRATSALTALHALPATSLAAGPSSSLAHDPLRPQYHLMPPGNWMNDPNGPIFWKGRYHLFYQLNPHGAAWGDISWGHAVSRDMVHWRNLPPALEPTPDSPDSYGVFSGSALAHAGRCYAFYTGTRIATAADATTHGDPDIAESQCLAIASDPELRHWTKHPQPLIATPPPGLAVTGFRDPSVWRSGDAWYMTVGSGVHGVGGMVLLYRSHDLEHWEYLHPLDSGSPVDSTNTDAVAGGEMWECPDFFPLGDRHVLLYSTAGKVWWTTGRLDPTTMLYQVETRGVLDTGAYYAPKSMLAPDQRRILWGWIRETRPEAVYVRAGWAGVMSLPRVLTLATDGSLAMQIAEEVDRLAGRPVHCQPEASLSGLAARLQTQLAPGGACTVRSGSAVLLTLLRSIDGGEIHANGIVLSGRPEASLFVYIDASVIEIFQGGQCAHTARVYPQLDMHPSLTVSVTGTDTNASVQSMRPISPNRLTGDAYSIHSLPNAAQNA